MTTSPHHADVFSHLRAAVARELQTPEVAALLEALISRGWLPAQLRQRVGALPVQPSLAQDAAAITQLLRQLTGEPSPQARRAEERAARVRERAEAERRRPVPAAGPDRERWLAEIRTGLKGRPRVAPARPTRDRPTCALCATPSAFFVRRDVHLCSRCVDVLAAGAVVARRRTGS